MLHIRSSKVGGQTWFISPFITLQFPNFFGPFYQYFPGNILERRGENWTSAEISQFQLSCSSQYFWLQHIGAIHNPHGLIKNFHVIVNFNKNVGVWTFQSNLAPFFGKLTKVKILFEFKPPLNRQELNLSLDFMKNTGISKSR